MGYILVMLIRVLMVKVKSFFWFKFYESISFFIDREKHLFYGNW